MGWISDFMGWFKTSTIKAAVIVNNKPEPYNTYDPALSSIPQCGIDLIKSFEKCRLIGYPDQGGVPTDGYGNTFGAKIGVPITQSQADADLIRNLGWAWLAVKKAVKVPLSQNQAGAILSFCYNLGETRFEKDGAALLFMLNSGNYAAIPNKIKQFVYFTRPDGSRRISQGLVNRRKAEALLFIGGDWRQA